MQNIFEGRKIALLALYVAGVVCVGYWSDTLSEQPDSKPGCSIEAFTAGAPGNAAEKAARKKEIDAACKTYQ
jgi:hypothetical protein